MQTDISGWVTRLCDEDIVRYTASGAWRDVTVADCAARLAQRAPDRVGVLEGERSVSFRRLFDEAQRLAAALRGRGLQPGDVMSFQLPNWVETLVINLAACLAGLVANPIVPIYRDAELRHILRDARSRLFFVPASFRGFDHAAMAQRLRPALPMLREVVVVRGEAPGCTPYPDLLACARSGPPPEGVDPNAVKLLLYTSGTTGSAKGVLHSHNTIMSEIDAVIGFWRITDRDVVLMPSPVTHITGYLYALETAFAAGVKTVLMERWNAAEAIELITRHGVTFSVGATPFLKELVAEAEARQAALSSLRLFMTGGAPVPPEIVYRAQRVLPGCMTFRVYGSSEAPTITLGIRSRAENDLGATTDGRIVNHEVRLADPMTGAPVQGDADGEICTRGPELMLGYTDWRQTQESFDADGYFRTGDLGHCVAGHYLCVTGRKKDLIIRGGENISPKEIEDVLHTHPAIREAAVVAMPHERLGEGVCAFVIPCPGHVIDVASAAAHLERAGLARQKFPERVELVEELPRTASGKVQKNVLRERIAAQIAREKRGRGA
ncbi:MAG TPA: AMP-binding protein [Burkholderiales bacterium]|nr:AMP-binding protein [Burkholderiales bacterium]